MSFAHLHNHLDHSVLDGFSRIDSLVSRAKALGQPALAATDHGTLSGAYEFYQACVTAGVKPIMGLEAYVAPKSRFHKEPVYWGDPSQKSDDVSGGGRFTHLTLLAMNNTGLRNLIKLSSIGWTEGRASKWPRLDRELMSQYSGGIIATTGCPGGSVQTRLRLGQFEEAVKEASTLQDIFGVGNVFCEFMDHGLDLESRVLDDLRALMNRLAMPPVVSNDSHFVMPDDARAHDALLAIQTGSKLSDPNRFKFGGSGYYLRSAEEMYALNDADYWQLGCRNTLAIAERVDPSGMWEKHDLMPRAILPDGVTAEQHLRALTEPELARRGVDNEKYRSRLEYELQVINAMGYASYFLFTSDFVCWARRQGIQVGCRGSGAASLAGYLLGITDADPVKYDLIFERLLNPERPSYPDFDADVADDRRNDVINYVIERYGEDHVAHISTFGRIGARAAIKDSARVLDKPYSLGNQMTRLVPGLLMGRAVTLEEMYDKSHPRYGESAEFRKLADTDTDAREVVELARELEGVIRSTGVHAAGIVVSPEPISDHVPLQQGADGVTKVQFDYPTAEALGLVKVDVLGLKTLTVVANTLKSIPGGLDLQAIPEDDSATYALLQSGDTLGCFQLDSGPMRALLRQLEPERIADLAAVVALYRPGPLSANTHTEYAERKNGRKPIRPIHEELAAPLADALGSTYGLVVYQESILKAAQVVAGYSLGRADVLRKAIGKKRTDIMAAEREPFAKGMAERGYSPAAVSALWSVIEGASDYSFNKSHAVMYGILAYRTAYLKANYAAEYMAALLTSEAGDPEKRAVYLAECRRMGVAVMVPDINASGAEFTPHSGSVRFGLASVKNVGAAVVEDILRARESGAFTSFEDYLERVAAGRNKRVVESLIQAGAFDQFGHPRKGLMEVREALVKGIVKLEKKRSQGQGELFEAAVTIEHVKAADIFSEEWTMQYKLTAEREVLGLYVSAHPLDDIAALLAEKSDAPLPQILSDEDAFPQDEPVTFAGLISAVDVKVNKQGKPWTIATVEDLDTSVEVLCFARDFSASAPYIVLNNTVIVRGRVDRRDGVKVIATAFEPLEHHE